MNVNNTDLLALLRSQIGMRVIRSYSVDIFRLMARVYGDKLYQPEENSEWMEKFNTAPMNVCLYSGRTSPAIFVAVEKQTPSTCSGQREAKIGKEMHLVGDSSVMMNSSKWQNSYTIEVEPK
jgi:hypothetical protein